MTSSSQNQPPSGPGQPSSGPGQTHPEPPRETPNPESLNHTGNTPPFFVADMIAGINGDPFFGSSLPSLPSPSTCFPTTESIKIESPISELDLAEIRQGLDVRSDGPRRGGTFSGRGRPPGRGGSRVNAMRGRGPRRGGWGGRGGRGEVGGGHAEQQALGSSTQFMPTGQVQDPLQGQIHQEKQASQEHQNPWPDPAVPYSDLAWQAEFKQLLDDLEALRYITNFPPRDEFNMDPSPAQSTPSHLAGNSQNTTQINPVQGQQQTQGVQSNEIPQQNQPLLDSIRSSGARIVQHRQLLQHVTGGKLVGASELQQITCVAQGFATACFLACEEVERMLSLFIEGHQHALHSQNKRLLRACDLYNITLDRLARGLNDLKGKTPIPTLGRPPRQQTQPIQTPQAQQTQPVRTPQAQQTQAPQYGQAAELPQEMQQTHQLQMQRNIVNQQRVQIRQQTKDSLQRAQQESQKQPAPPAPMHWPEDTIPNLQGINRSTIPRALGHRLP